MNEMPVRAPFPKFRSTIAGAAILALGAQAALACTVIILHPQDGSTVVGRTMEFGFDIQSNILAIPAGTRIETLVLDSDQTGFTYEARYGFLGANGLDMPIVFDVNGGIKSGHWAAQKPATLGLGVTRGTRRRPVSRASQIAGG